MFQFTRKPSSGSHSQYLAKIAQLVQSGYIEFIQDIMTVMLEQLPYFRMFSLSLSLSNGTTSWGGPRPPSRVSSILPGLG